MEVSAELHTPAALLGAPEYEAGWAPETIRTQKYVKKYVLLIPGIELRFPGLQSAAFSLHRLNMGRYCIREYRICWSLVLEETLALTTLCQPRYDGKKIPRIKFRYCISGLSLSAQILASSINRHSRRKKRFEQSRLRGKQ